MADRFWSTDPDERVSWHATAEEARAAALKALEWQRDQAGDGWDEEAVHQIAWGETRERAVQTSVETHLDTCRTDEFDGECDDDCPVEGSYFDEIWEFELLPFGDGAAVDEVTGG